MTRDTSRDWIVDARADAIRFEILHLAGTAYRADTPDSNAQTHHVLGRAFVLERRRNRLGRWSYVLQVTDQHRSSK